MALCAASLRSLVVSQIVRCFHSSLGRALPSIHMEGLPGDLEALSALRKERLQPSAESLALEIGRAHDATRAALEAARHKLLRALGNRRALAMSYRQLERLQEQLKKKYSVSYSLKFVHLNRYVDVLPYDHTRVSLRLQEFRDRRDEREVVEAGIEAVDASLLGRRSISEEVYIEKRLADGTEIEVPMRTSKEGHQGEVPRQPAAPSAGAVHHDYINASLVRNPDHEHPVQWRYIVTQGPLSHTCGSFWRMVLQQNVKAIVMLTNFEEGNRPKCDVYFPAKARDALTFEGIHIYNDSEPIPNRAQGYVQRLLAVSESPLIQSGDEMPELYRVAHFQFTEWPDHGVPSNPKSVLDLCATLRQHKQQCEGTNVALASMHESSLARPAQIGTVLVHCSAGIGRSGVFCVIDAAIQQLIASGDLASEDVEKARAMAEQAVDVHRLVMELRHQRPRMVQTFEQYCFCYEALLYAIEQALMLSDPD